MRVKHKDNSLEIYLEKRTRRVFVGELKFDPQKKEFQFSYNDQYRKDRSAIPVGAELGLKKRVHESAKLFPSFQDRIPERANPAYKEYCYSMGISTDERNPIVLLGTIGRRGPSSFVFELVPQFDLEIGNMVSAFRKQLNLTLSEMANFLEVTEVTLVRMEKGQLKDYNVHRLVRCILESPEIGLWQLGLSKRKLASETYEQIGKYYTEFIDRETAAKVKKSHNCKMS